jgi:hypothetical protein
MPADEPDLMAELDAAEAIVMGTVSAVETEWGVRYGDSRGTIGVYGTGPDNERHARWDAGGEPGVLVRRTVTYSEWETVT